MADRRSIWLRGAPAVGLATLGLLAACAGPADRTTMPATTMPATTMPAITTALPPPVDRTLRVLVVGDSVAASLAGDDRTEHFTIAGFGEVEVVNIGSVACPIIFDGDWWFTDGSTLPDNPACDRPDRYDDEIVTFAPDVVLTVFGWPGVGGGQRFADGTIARPCEPRFDQAWRTGYEQMIQRLAPHATVVASTVAPISMDARRRETRCLNDVVRRLPATVFDLQEWLCPGLDCSARAELRTDGVHFAGESQLRRTAMEGILAEIVPHARQHEDR